MDFTAIIYSLNKASRIHSTTVKHSFSSRGTFPNLVFVVRHEVRSHEFMHEQVLVLYTVIVSIWNRHLRLYWARSGLIIVPILTAVCISQETPKYWSWEVMLMEMNRTSTLLPTVCSTWERISVEWVVSLWKHVNFFWDKYVQQICMELYRGLLCSAW